MKRIRSSLILTSILCAVLLASCQAPEEGKPQSSGTASTTNTTIAETTTTPETEASLEEGTTTQRKETTTTASKKTTVKTKAPTTTTKKPESTSTPTTYTLPFNERYSDTRTKSFNEQYSIDTVVITIKDEYVDFDKQYTAKDFPGLDIKEIKIYNFDKTHSQGLCIYLNKSGETEVRKAIEILSKNPIIESATFDSICTTD